MPNGGTEIRGGDVVTVLTQDGDAEGISELFTSETGLADP